MAELGPFRFTGFAAWLVWLFVHMALLVGFRNRVVALLSWGIDYFFYDRPVRLITIAPPVSLNGLERDLYRSTPEPVAEDSQRVGSR